MWGLQHIHVCDPQLLLPVHLDYLGELMAYRDNVEDNIAADLQGRSMGLTPPHDYDHDPAEHASLLTAACDEWLG